jgi:hypothetical protein
MVILDFNLARNHIVTEEKGVNHLQSKRVTGYIPPEPSRLEVF